MPEAADLEIGLHRRDVTSYAVDLRFVHPQSDADVRLLRGSDLPLVRFDYDHLRSRILNTVAYGQALTQSLFSDPELVAAFGQASAAAHTLDVPLRVRLFIGPSAPDLHALRWETLCLPGSTDPLLTNEHILFSRYLSSTDWRPVRLRPKRDLRALVFVANPTDIEAYQLSPVDVHGEVARAQESMGNDVATTVLAAHGDATLDTLIAHLRDGYDILYLVAHGVIKDGEPYLWLEDTHGTTAITTGRDLVRQMRDLRERPRLVVLASCQSAGSGDDRHSQDGGTLAALGPRLAELGIPAVLAMQDRVSMRTVATFLPVFFRELLRDGQIDRAMAAARGAVQARHDWWVPVLFLRLKNGCIWYVPGFGDERTGFERWPALLKNIHRGQCTPLLGTHLSELLGTQLEIAHRWSDTHTYPLEPYRSEHLSQVAQYLAVTQQPMFPRDDLLDQLRHEILLRYGEKFPEDAHQGTLEDLLALVGHIRRTNEADPYRLLADLPFPVYLTANFTNLLTEALRAAGKHPVVEICRWNEYIETLPSVYDTEPNYLPDVQRPLVYHLFGHLSEPDSLVVTEDDYFDYLIGFSANDDLVPAPVNEALADNGLLFLGFQPDDWDFRILFRSLAKLWVGRRRRRYINIAAQIAPDENRMQEPVRARRYLEAYFQEANIDIYWGTVEDFARDMLVQWRAGNTQRKH